MRIENIHKGAELLIDLIQGALEEEGHETKRYSDSKKYDTSAYDCIVIKGNDGNYYELMVSISQSYRHPYTGKYHGADETFNRI